MARILTLCTAGLLSLALSGCAEQDILSPSQLNSNPALHDGQMVTVRGYVVIAPEGHNLQDSKKIFDEFAAHYSVTAKPDPSFDPQTYDRYCLTLANYDVIYDHMATFRGKTLIFRGRFFAHYLPANEIDFWGCALPTAIVLDTDDLKARYGRELNLNHQ